MFINKRNASMVSRDDNSTINGTSNRTTNGTADVGTFNGTMSGTANDTINGNLKYLSAGRVSPEAGNIIEMVFALFGLLLVSQFLSIRLNSARKTPLNQLTPLHYIVFAVYILSCGFCISTLLLRFAVGVSNATSCSAAMVLCLVFYLGQKYGLYLFLVEKIHATQGSKKERIADPIYLVGLAFVLVGFTALAFSAFLMYRSQYVTSMCYIGFQRPLAIAIVVYDVFVNVFLTCVFFYFIKEFLAGSLLMNITPTPFRPLLRRLQGKGLDDVNLPQEKLVHVIRKTFWGCVGILFTTVVNFSMILHFSGGEEVWICYTLCTIDVCWAAVIIFWLTQPVSVAKKDNYRSANQEESQHLRNPSRSARDHSTAG